MKPAAERKIKEGDLAAKIQQNFSARNVISNKLESKEVRNIIKGVLTAERDLVDEIGRLPQYEG